MFMFKINEPIKVIHLQKLANQSMLNDALVIEVVSSSFSESKKNMKNIFPLEFIRYLSYSERQRTEKLLMFRSVN